MSVVCLLILFCGIMMTDNKTQILPKVANEKKSYSVALSGEVESIAVKNITPSDVKMTVNLKMELKNNGSKPVIILEVKPPELRGAVLAKSPDGFSASKRLVLEYYGESVDITPEWSVLRDALIQPSPPLDKVRVLKPNKSRKWEASIDIALPRKSNTNYFSDKRESWETVKELPAVWLRVVCQVWSLNLEPNGENRSNLIVGNELQRRWKDVGLLWLDDILSEPIALNLKGAVAR